MKKMLSRVAIRHSLVSNNWGPMQIISVIKAQGANHFRFYSVLYHSYKVQNVDAS